MGASEYFKTEYKRPNRALGERAHIEMTDKKRPCTEAREASDRKRAATSAGTASMRMSNLSHALSVITADVYLRLDDPMFRACRPVVVRPMSKAAAKDAVYATWKPKESIFFTLAKAGRDTVVFCHQNGTAYLSAPAARLASDCPDGAVFLCQWCVDRDAGAKVPRLLVFDVLDDVSCGDVVARGERLRGLSKYLPQPICVVQWVGEPAALDGFVRRLPHPVDCIISLSEDPLRLYRHMRVEVPHLNMAALEEQVAARAPSKK